MHSYIHTSIHTYMHSHIHTYIQAYINTHKYTHKHIQIHTGPECRVPQLASLSTPSTPTLDHLLTSTYDHRERTNKETNKPAILCHLDEKDPFSAHPHLFVIQGECFLMFLLLNLEISHSYKIDCSLLV